MKIIRYVIISALCGTCFFSAVSCKKSKASGGNTPNDTTATAVKYVDTLPPSTPLKHPGGLCTQSDFDRIKVQVNAGTEPWISGWNKLVANSHAQTSYQAHPTVKIIRGGNSPEEPQPDNYPNAMNDAAAAFQLGIRWKVTGDATFAQAAVNILNAWAGTCTTISGDPNAALASGIYGYEFAIAGEQLRDYSGWATADFKKYQQWMLNVFYPVNYGFLSGHFG